MGIALFLIGVLIIVAGVVLFIVALVKRSGWWVLRSGAIFGAGLILVIIGVAIGISEKPSEEVPSGTPTIVIADYEIRLNDVGVDKLYIDEVIIELKNDGDASTTITELVISSNGAEIRGPIFFVTLGPGEKQEISCSGSLSSHELSKPIGVTQLAATVTILGYPKGATGGRILAEEDVAISIPKISVGSTIPAIEGKQGLSLALLSWKESNIAVDGPYGSSYYTFTAKPNMKFVILIYRFQNSGIREQETPYINAGEIATDEGYIYSVWSPPVGVYSEEYKPREATIEEVDRLIGDSGGFEDLLQEETTIGCVVFEIPAGATPIEASLAYLPVLIKF